MLAHSICTVNRIDTTAFKHEFSISSANAPEMDSGFNLDLQTLSRYTDVFTFSCPGRRIFLAGYWLFKTSRSFSCVFGVLKLNLELARSVRTVKKLKLFLSFLMLRNNQRGYGQWGLYHSLEHLKGL